MASVLQKLPLQVKHRGLAKLLAAKPNAEVLTENQCQRWVRALLMLIFYFLPSISSCRLFLGHPQKLVYCEKGKHWKPVSEMQGFKMCPNCRQLHRSVIGRHLANSVPISSALNRTFQYNICITIRERNNNCELWGSLIHLCITNLLLEQPWVVQLCLSDILILLERP